MLLKEPAEVKTSVNRASIAVVERPPPDNGSKSAAPSPCQEPPLTLTSMPDGGSIDKLSPKLPLPLATETVYVSVLLPTVLGEPVNPEILPETLIEVRKLQVYKYMYHQ